ncbi:hypothetical protein EHS25_000697 [Saitozyma podzolica]|uniref:Dethiobiotin synthase n=1 Tax=Saitozyma podzolica TaxID=1890683 RepID=A0A427YX08_9TREE|nr:hypothetical protein EHS25_000697 [Saitozyma podzolica]
MPLLFPNLRITQVFGANTDVGKTLLTTALLRASASQYASNRGDATAKSGKGKRVFYLKPVSTGSDDEADVNYVLRNTRPYAGSIATHNLFQYREPMSPHLAAKLAPDLPFPKSNDELVRGVEGYTRQCLEELGGQRGTLYVETAGGVHSPALHPPHTQATSLRPLLLPSILIASPHLGGISTTLSSYESLLMRGYSISAVLCIHHPYYRNDDFLAPYFAERGIRFYSITPPPEKYGTVQEDGTRLGEWYAEVEMMGEAGQDGGGVRDVARWLDEEHDMRVEELNGMPKRTLDSVWWPFTQHGLINKKEDVMVIDSAHGDRFDAYYTKPQPQSLSSSSSASTDQSSLLNSYFDGSASWFTQSHGHGSDPLTLAAANAAGRYGHVLFPSGTHAPALNLAEKLISTVGKGWASRVFFSDNGSTGMEVALKMGLRASGRRYGWEGEIGGDVGVIGLRGGYHGDTIGAMDASEASTYNTAVDWYRGRGHWFSPPSVQFINGVPSVSTTPPDSWPSLPSLLSETSTSAEHGWTVPFASLEDIYDLSTRLSSSLATYYRGHIRSTLSRLTLEEGRQFGALVMEPTCLGAGGMVFVDPLFQACLVEVCRASGDLFGKERWAGGTYEEELAGLKSRKGEDWRGLPVIYDEVFSGLYRFGYNSASTVLSQTPDIAAYAKILTGGLLPLSTTLASTSIFDAFLSDRKVDALLHGHSYTANPVGCAVALKAAEMIERHEQQGGWDTEKAMWGVRGTRGDEDRVGVVRGEEEGRWSFWNREFVKDVSTIRGVKGSMAMGTVLAVELEDAEGGYSSHTALNFLTKLRQEPIGPVSQSDQFQPFQIHSRPLGNVVYVITNLWTKPEVMRAMEGAITKHLHAIQG